MNKTLVILNPDAGALRERPTLLTTLQAHGAVAGAEFVLSQGPDQTRALARDARKEGRERLMVAGGDGTLHHAVNGLLEGLDSDALPSPHDLPILAVLPMGTGNDLARSLGMPLAPWDALDALDWSRVQPLDLIRTEGLAERWCVNLISGGLASPEDPLGETATKDGLGILAYWRRGVEAVAEGHPSYRLSLVLDDEEEETLQAQNLVLANGRFVAGGIPVAPTARLDDGLLDLLVVPEMDLAEMSLLFPRLLMGKHQEHEAILSRRVRKLAFQSEPELALSLDGEEGKAAEGGFRVVEGALRVVAGPEEDAENTQKE